MSIITENPDKKNAECGFNVIPPKQHLHGRCLGLPVRGCGNSNSPAPLTEYKLNTAWHENRKIRYENKLLKAKEPAPDV
jgi:hypothetical protein